MVVTHNLGFPRIGAKRELKFAQEAYWRGEQSASDLHALGAQLRSRHWQSQQLIDWVPVGDFSFYDQVLDMSFLLGNVPDRAKDLSGNALDQYFRVARGRSANDAENQCIHAGEMTKWFDTNYHYIVPEVSSGTQFKLNAKQLIDQIKEAHEQGVSAKPVIIGPVTYLWLSKARDGSSRLALLESLVVVYQQLLAELSGSGVDWVQIDEPILVMELDDEWRRAFVDTYNKLKLNNSVRMLLATYFGGLHENCQLASQLPVAGLHIDAVSDIEGVERIVENLPSDKVLSLGVVSGRNIWKTDLNKVLDWLEPIAKQLKQRLWIAPSCSLLHVPVDLKSEEHLDKTIKRWLAFALQKLDEIDILAKALNRGRGAVSLALEDNAQAISSRQTSLKVHNAAVARRIDQVEKTLGDRESSYSVRARFQQEALNLPIYPTTTIGSFPQTKDIRSARRQFKKGELDAESYRLKMEAEIKRAVDIQETLGLDVLVHGEAERNDMVEYFGEQLEGYAFSEFGWVQSYGSRCVKPPILFGDISRPCAMTVDWAQYAQSLTGKPMKGMLTGPVTMLNWSFVRDDQPRHKTCLQLALAIRDEVQDLEKAGIKVIQIDEAALREGLPLRQSQWQAYLNWAIECYRISANGVKNETQIHTHMCYSEFNDIIEAIARMDADVITIETSRSGMELLDVFDTFNYPNAIGPGVYDIHSPNTPSKRYIVDLMQKASQRIPRERLWINPDCGLKTRQWGEVIPALECMISSAYELRARAISESA